mgnify:CR=1 FL=1|tara:strand:+ start:1191 stop:1448 length:258 start_codon:yes stop_codon:yes gene_type:complete
METSFNIGDLVRFKPTEYTNKVFQDLSDAESLVLVTDTLKNNTGYSKKFFYGMLLSTGVIHLWNNDQFYLVSTKNDKKNFERKLA